MIRYLKIILISFFWLITNHLFAQSSEKRMISDIDSIHYIIDKIVYDAPDSALLLANKTLQQAQSINYDAGYSNALEYIGKAFRVKGEYDSAWQIYDRLKGIALERSDSTLLGTINLQLGFIYADQGQYQQSIEVLDQAEAIFIQTNDDADLAEVYNLLGNSYADIGNYVLALDSYQKALNIDMQVGDKIGMASRYNNIARIYNFRNDYDKALEYYQKAFDLAVILDELADQAIYSNNLAYLLKLQGRYNEALIFLFKALKIQRANKAPCGQIYPAYNIGSIYVKQNLLDSAEMYLNYVLPKTLECSNDQYLRSLTLIDLGNLFIAKKEYDEALKYLVEALKTSRDYKLAPQALASAKILSAVYDSLGEQGESLRYFKTYHDLYDTINNKESTRRIARLEAQYEYEQKHQQDSLNQRVKELESATQLSNAIWTRNSLVVGFVFLGVVTLMIFINYNRKNKANAKLSDLNKQILLQKNELEHQAEELRNANEEITRINENLEQIVNARTAEVKEQNKKIVEYVYYNSHKVRGPLARILGLVDLFQRNGISTEEIQDKLSELKKEAVELDAMVRQMNRSLEKQKKSLNE